MFWRKKRPYQDKGWVWLTLRHKELHQRYARNPSEEDKKDHAEVARELNKRFTKKGSVGHKCHDKLDEDHKHILIQY